METINVSETSVTTSIKCVMITSDVLCSVRNVRERKVIIICGMECSATARFQVVPGKAGVPLSA
jgi:hypothetical protein